MIAIVKIFKGGKTTIEEKDGNKVKVGNGAKVVVSKEYCDAHEYLEPFSEENESSEQEALRLEEIEKAKREAVEAYKAGQKKTQLEKDKLNDINDSEAKAKEDESLFEKEEDSVKVETPKGRSATNKKGK
jgi:hypothetical protein